MDNIQEAINWFDAEIKAQESGYAFALANGKERDEHFENWLDIMRTALVALRNEHGRVRGCEYCNTEHNKLEEVLKARKEAEQKPPCQKCNYLFWIDKETPFCKRVDKFILPELPPNKCELKEGE